MAAAGELRPFEVILFDGGSTLFYFAGNPVEVLRQGVKELSAILADAVLAAAVLAGAASQLDKEAFAQQTAQQSLSSLLSSLLGASATSCCATTASARWSSSSTRPSTCSRGF